MNLSELQSEFFHAVLGQENDFPNQVVEQGSIDNAQRVHIYRNAYLARLYETLETDHEILGFYLGDDLFDQMVQGYVEQYPSQHRSLRNFGQQLPEFLRVSEPFSNYPVITELARFERTLLAAFDAAENQRVSFSDLRNLSENDWPGLTLQFHPSTRLYSSSWNCVEVWQALKAENAPPDAVEQKAHWCVWRNVERLTEFASMRPEDYQFAQLVMQGENFSAVCEALADTMDPEEVSQYAVNTLATWFESGIVSRIVIEH